MSKINFDTTYRNIILKFMENLFYFDISKAKKILNWKPKFSNIESIIESYENYLLIKNKLKKDNYRSHNSILKKGLLKYAHYFF